MAAVKKQSKPNGYGEKQTVQIITVDKARRRVECAMRDGAMVWAAVWETGTVFRWPEVGETWTIRKDTGVWRLDQIVQSTLLENESEATPLTLEELGEGNTRIVGNKVHVNQIQANTIVVPGVGYDYGIVSSLPTEPAPIINYVCTYKVTTGIYWRLIYTGEATYPWVKVGGPPLYAQDTGAESRGTESEIYQTGGMPSFNMPSIKAESLVRWGAKTAFTVVPGTQMRLTAFINSIELDWALFANGGAANGLGSVHAARKITTLSGNKIETRFKRNEGSGLVEVFQPFIEVDPIRVG